LDSRGKDAAEIVGSGYLERVAPRTYRLTPKGLAEIVIDAQEDAEKLERVNRVLEAEVTRIIEHPAFVEWLKDHSRPKSFREVGHFWSVAPGTPPRVVLQRVQSVENTLETALSLLDSLNVDQIGDRRGHLLFEREDVLRGLEFHRAMSERFAKELRLLTQHDRR
jgi:hypothetical protein